VCHAFDASPNPLRPSAGPPLLCSSALSRSVCSASLSRPAAPPRLDPCLAGLKLRWVGAGVGEMGVDAANATRVLVRVDPNYFRPTEVGRTPSPCGHTHPCVLAFRRPARVRPSLMCVVLSAVCGEVCAPSPRAIHVGVGLAQRSARSFRDHKRLAQIRHFRHRKGRAGW
jgi:hypothetical protein